MTSKPRCFRAATALAGLLLAVPALAAAGAHAAEPRNFSIDVTDEKPLAAVIRELERRHGAVITYEDPPYAAAADVVSATGTAGAAGGRPRLRKSRLTLSYAVSAETGNPDDMAAVVQEAIDLHAAAGNPGRFRLEREGSILHVIPVEVRGSDGRWETVRPCMDTRIDLTEEDRSLAETFQLILNAVSLVTDWKMGIIDAPINAVVRTRLRLGARSETARQVLTKANSALGPGSSWRLLFDPHSGAMLLQVYDVKNR
jgi:hypothetical protein